MTVVNDYTALLSGSYWNGIEVTGRPAIVTFSFPTSMPSYDVSIDGFTAATLSSFSAFGAAEQAQALAALGEWAAASGLIFLQVAPGQGDINFQNIDFDTTTLYSGYGGIGFYPFGNWDFFSYPYFNDDLDSSGEIFMNSQFQAGDGTVNYGTLLHEIGHALGLKHPTEIVTDFAADPDVVHDQVLSSDDPARTIMATVGDGSPSGTPHLLQLDMDAVAFIYGAAGTGGIYTSSDSGLNAVSSWNWDSSTQVLIQSAVTVDAVIRGISVTDIINGSSGNDQLFGLAGDDDLSGFAGNDSLYGGSGTDTLIGGEGDDSYFITSSAADITEQSGEGTDAVYSTASFVLPDNVETLSLFGSGLTGQANGQGASLFGDGTYATNLIGGAGADYIVGGGGNDTIAGHAGPDQMWGQGGADTFIFTALADAPVGDPSVIGDYADGVDRIDLSAIRTTAGPSPGSALTFIGASAFSNQAGQLHQVTSGANTILEGDVDGNGTADFQILLYGNHTLQNSDFVLDAPPCYRAGTHILTMRGQVAVEDLTTGDTAITASGRHAPIVWIGHRRVDCRRHPDPRLVWPIRVCAGAFGPRVPTRDLWLSPDHAAFIDGHLIPIRHLINGASIAQVPVQHVTYFHVELDRHDILLAECLPAESYLDTGNRGSFANAHAPMALHPTFDRTGPAESPKSWDHDAAAPLTNAEPVVRPIWQRLADRATRDLGLTVPHTDFTQDPEVHLEVDGKVLLPLRGAAAPRVLTFLLPADFHTLRLRSRSAFPTDARPWIDDRRRLGIFVERLTWIGLDGPHDIALDTDELRDGWWQVEQEGRLLRRWTDGNARLPHRPDALLLRVHVAGTLAYPLDQMAMPNVADAA
ncbi:MAG: Hint domain-containing protein [Acetobacteraceae bacterium]